MNYSCTYVILYVATWGVTGCRKTLPQLCAVLGTVYMHKFSKCQLYLVYIIIMQILCIIHTPFLLLMVIDASLVSSDSSVVRRLYI